LVNAKLQTMTKTNKQQYFPINKHQTKTTFR